MPGPCSHEFFWPLRAPDGNYYQLCRLCGVQYAYDWENMRRRRGGSEPVPASPATSPGASFHRNAPRLRLLVEPEPAYRVFFRNLRDTLRPPSPEVSGIPRVPFWREIIFESGIPWLRFGESMVCHMVALAILLVAQVWTSEELPRRRSMFANSHLTYYKPTGSFPALRGNPGRARPSARKQSESARGGAPLRVASEKARAQAAAVNAPDLKLNGPARPNIVGSNLVAPMMPLASAQSSRRSGSMGSAAAVAPPADVEQGALAQGTSRRPGWSQGSIVAPAPEVGAVASRNAMTVAGGAVIGPPPTVQGSMRRAGDINIGPSAVVAPSPQLPLGEQSTLLGAGRQAGLGSSAALAVPPPPSVQRAGGLGNGRAGLLSSGGASVVPPPPSIQGVGGSADGRISMGSMSGSGVQVVAPPPSLQGAGNSGTGRSGGGFSTAGVQVVPPAPSLQGAGSSGAGRSGGGFSTAGAQVVPPAPSLQGPGAGEGRSGSALAGGVQGVGPAPSVGAGGNSDHGGRQMAMNTAPTLAPGAAPIIDNARPKDPKPPEPATEVMPLRLIGMAMALPSSSYFSNYEVFIAERRLSKGLAQFIKLVYVSLPYQRRLSEYGVDNTKILKLLVIRDRSCDESLLQMTWPENDPHPDAHNPADSPALSREDRNGMLPCYRTTADDYRKAISKR